MTKIYVVTVHTEEEFRVIAAFDEASMTDALNAAKLVGGEVKEVAELNRFDHDEPPAGMLFFHVSVYKGEGGSVRSLNVLTNGLDDVSLGRLHKTGYRLYKRDGRWPSWSMFARLYAPDEQTAVKIVDNIRIKLLAGELPEEGPIPTL